MRHMFAIVCFNLMEIIEQHTVEEGGLQRDQQQSTIGRVQRIRRKSWQKSERSQMEQQIDRKHAYILIYDQTGQRSPVIVLGLTVNTMSVIINQACHWSRLVRSSHFAPHVLAFC